MDDGRIADSFRRWGYLQADLDPLGRLAPAPHPELDEPKGTTAERFRRLYCGTIGAEFMHMPHPERCRFVAERMEAEPPPLDDGERRRILASIAEAELLERLLHARYVGTKRYSLEGAAALLPLLEAVLDDAAARGAEVAVVAMSHRGRLNVMVQIASTPLASLIAGFEDVSPRSVLGGGDVKYHKGATGDHRTFSGKTLHVHLVSNPSHLEAVNPVAMGRARARQVRLGEEGVRRVLPITIHGDAAFAGQGITAETLNLSELRGFAVGGTVQVVVNNLIGFTTNPSALHSSRFATDVAKRLAAPIFHVNAEDPEAVVRAARLAAEYRARFATDVVVDLIGYRRYGHSEVDDPTTTHPVLYRRIAARPLLAESYAERSGLGDRLEEIRQDLRQRLDRAQEEARAMTSPPSLRTLPSWWGPYHGGRYERDLEVATAVPAERIEELARGLTTVPAELELHPKVKKGLEERLRMGLGQEQVDWGMGEALAFASLLRDGVLVRLAGQDSRRGTFSQRHAVLFDVKTGEEYTPLAHLDPSQARIELHDTMLSEAACLGFEYGFSRDYPDALVCWEAQFGDFANGAQVIIDQFLSAGEDKWGLLSGLVLLLPHGYEGQGPEHSSARLERFLQVAGEDNIQVAQPTTAAQYFHLLRRQALRRWRKPLVVLTPKSMLRSAAATSPREALTGGAFAPVLAGGAAADAARVLVCSGKIAHELEADAARRDGPPVAVLRLEQLYPFPEEELTTALAAHPSAHDILWVQEEPANMGALAFVLPLLERLTGGRPVRTVKRSPSASPSTGSLKAHQIEQRALLDVAFLG